MRVIAPSEASGGGFTLSEFDGKEGPWTVMHVHEQFEESFFVLEGKAKITAGDEEIEAEPGMFVMVKRGTPHMIGGQPGGVRALVIAAPGGHEAMFRELSQLGPDAIRDPKVRSQIAKRHDSRVIQK